MRKLELLNAYRTFWSGFEAICRTAGATSKPNDGRNIRLDEAASTEGRLVITTFSYFPQWRYKSSSAKERVNILVKSSETYRQAENQVTRSNVQVLYLRPGDDSDAAETAETLLAVHYDFELPIPDAHPVFHAQLGGSDFPQAKLNDVGFRSSIGPLPAGATYSNVRIPTPCMGFGSVLLALAADHLQPQTFKQVLKLVRRSEITKWSAACPALQASMVGGNYLPSHHWYEE